MAERGIALKVESEDSMMIRTMDGESIDVSRSSEDIIDGGRMAENPNSVLLYTIFVPGTGLQCPKIQNLR